jgi:type II secretory pathway pseudopilin PulG
MLPRARQTEAEDGFILIEVLVSALILAIVAGAVLTLITATTHSAASERDRSEAYGLAQEDQARLRTERISNLKELGGPTATHSKTVGGATFYVESRGEFVNNTTGTSSCSGEGATADYVELTSTVSSPTLRTPVAIHSIVSPSNESLDPRHGTFAFQAKNAAGEPLAGVSFSGTGAGNFNRSSNEEGCATFADIPAGNYQVTTSANGLVNPEGKTNPTLEIGVEASATQQHVFTFDRPGEIQATFFYKEPNGTEALAGIDSMELFNSENEQKAITFGTPGGAMASTLKDPSAYPFKTPYAVYAGSCTSNNPDPEKKGINTTAIANVAVTSGSLSKPRIQVPTLNVVVTDENNKLEGARVVVTDKICQYNTVKVARTFTTDKVGHIATSTAPSTEAVGIPYGEYTVCASTPFTRRSGGKTITEYHRAEKTVSAKSFGAPALQSLALATSGSSTEC